MELVVRKILHAVVMGGHPKQTENEIQPLQLWCRTCTHMQNGTYQNQQSMKVGRSYQKLVMTTD